MITRRKLLTGIAAGAVASVAAPTLIGAAYQPNVLESADHNPLGDIDAHVHCRYGCDVEYHAFSFVQAKPA